LARYRSTFRSSRGRWRFQNPLEGRPPLRHVLNPTERHCNPRYTPSGAVCTLVMPPSGQGLEPSLIRCHQQPVQARQEWHRAPWRGIEALSGRVAGDGGFKIPWRDDRRSASRVVSVLQTTPMRLDYETRSTVAGRRLHLRICLIWFDPSAAGTTPIVFAVTAIKLSEKAPRQFLSKSGQFSSNGSQ
jgi:hypothetical protein